MTAPSISGLRQALATNLATISGLRTASEIPDNPSPPIGIISLDGIDYDQAFKQGHSLYNFTVMVIVGRAAEREAQRRLDTYAMTSGVKDAIESDRGLGGLAMDTRVTGLTTIGSLQLNDQSYLVAEYAVTVFA